MAKTTLYTDRKFLGKINNFDSKEERRFEQKHLKAYKRGWERFPHGENLEGERMWHNVQQEVTTNTELENFLKYKQLINK